MESTSERTGWRSWGGRAALAVGGMLVGGVLVGTLTANAANTTGTANQTGAYGAANGGALPVGQALASVLGGRLGVVPVLSLQGVLYVVAGCAALTLLPLSWSTNPATDHTALAP